MINELTRKLEDMSQLLDQQDAVLRRLQSDDLGRGLRAEQQWRQATSVNAVLPASSNIKATRQQQLSAEDVYLAAAGGSVGQAATCNSVGQAATGGEEELHLEEHCSEEASECSSLHLLGSSGDREAVSLEGSLLELADDQGLRLGYIFKEQAAAGAFGNLGDGGQGAFMSWSAEEPEPASFIGSGAALQVAATFDLKEEHQAWRWGAEQGEDLHLLGQQATMLWDQLPHQAIHMLQQ
jgi:hypothetical protein